MEDIELHDAARVKSIIDKGGRYNASQSDVTRMATLLQTRDPLPDKETLRIIEGVPGPIMDEITKVLCRDYKVDIDSSSGIKLMETERQRFIGRIVMQILDLSSEGKVPLPPADVIAARAAYLCEEYMI